MDIDKQDGQSLDLDARSEHLLRKAETILRNRTDKVLLVLERVLDNTNYLGALRTAEILGIQQVWVVQLPRGHAKAEREAQRSAAQSKQKQGQGGQGGKRGRGRGVDKQHAGGADGEGADDAGTSTTAVVAGVETEEGAGEAGPSPAAASGAAGGTTAAASSAAQRRQRQRREEEAALRVQRAHDADAGAGADAGEGGEEGEGEGGEAGTEDGEAGAVGAGGAGGQEEEKLRQEIRKRLRFSRASAQWLDVRFFWSIADCISALKADGWTIWSTDLSPASVSLSSPVLQLPDKLALVMGREADGVSQDMLAASDARVYLPMYGFNGSFNVMVATGMALQAVLARWPSVRGSMSEGRRQALRTDWYAKLARTEAQRALFTARALHAPVEPYADAPDLKDLHLMGSNGLLGAAGGAEGEREVVVEEVA